MEQPEHRAGSIVKYLAETFRLVYPFWTSRQRGKAWFLLTCTLGLNFGTVAISARMSFEYADIMDSLASKHINEFTSAGLLYVGLVWLFILATIISIHVRNMLVIHWRKWLTDLFVGTYFRDRLFNQIELKNYGVDNPDQRLSMDIFNLCDETLIIFLDFLSNLARLGTFSAILWAVSGPLNFTLLSMEIHIPGYMFWVVLVYSIVVTWFTHAINSPMTRLEFQRQAAEANFRFRLLRVRENAESIALIGGERQETEALRGLFANIWTNWVELLKYKRRLFGIQALLGQMSLVFPIVTGMPAYLAGNTTFGGLMQIGQAFNSVSVALNWFVNSYTLLAQWKSSVDRVLSLQAALREAKRDLRESGFLIASNGGDEAAMTGLDIDLPDGRPLLRNVNITIRKGENTIVTGTSGCGKSTLFRTISGLWVWGGGSINLPRGSVIFVPQRPYLPSATLKAVLCYPMAPDEYPDTEITAAMGACRLSGFANRLGEFANWSRVLSGGEQQRVAFVRALLAKPDWLFLDEATAALDPDTETALYEALKTQLPDTTIINIAHRSSLRQHHARQLRLHAETQSVSVVSTTD